MEDRDESFTPPKDSATAGSLKNLDLKTRSLDKEPSPARSKQRWKPFAVVTFAFFVVAVLAVWTFHGATRTSEETDVTPPNDITVVETSPSRTRLAWTPSNTTRDFQVLYDVKVCVAHKSCAAGSGGQRCTRRHTPDPWLEFESTVGTPYCVQVTACALYPDKMVRSQPAYKKIETPLYAPGDFDVTATAIGPQSVQLVVFVPDLNNGALGSFYITLHGTNRGQSFSCNNRGGNTSTVVVNGLEPGRDYVLSVTFAIGHGDREVRTGKMISVTTTASPLSAGSEREDNTAYLLLLIPLCAMFSNKEHKRPRRRRSKQGRW